MRTDDRKQEGRGAKSASYSLDRSVVRNVHGEQELGLSPEERHALEERHAIDTLLTSMLYCWGKRRNHWRKKQWRSFRQRCDTANEDFNLVVHRSSVQLVPDFCQTRRDRTADVSSLLVFVKAEEGLSR